MTHKYFPQQLPKDIKDLQLERLSGEQLIDVCDDPDSPFYTSRCQDRMFWKDKILADFPIENEAWKKPKKKTIRDPKTKKVIRKEEIIGDKYDIFKSVNQYDPKWIYKVLHYYFAQTDDDTPADDIQDLLDDIYTNIDFDNVKLVNELMKDPDAIVPIITQNNDLAGPIYEKYPQYRKAILIILLFTAPNIIKQFQKKYQSTETFDFADLSKIIKSVDRKAIVSDDDAEDFGRSVLKYFSDKTNNKQKMQSEESDDSEELSDSGEESD